MTGLFRPRVMSCTAPGTGAAVPCKVTRVVCTYLVIGCLFRQACGYQHSKWRCCGARFGGLAYEDIGDRPFLRWIRRVRSSVPDRDSDRTIDALAMHAAKPNTLRWSLNGLWGRVTCEETG